MKTVSLAVALFAGFALAATANTASAHQSSNQQNKPQQNPTSVHSGHEKQESKLRECVVQCAPSKCMKNRELAKHCARLCDGHKMSLPDWIQRKCSMASSGIQSYSSSIGDQGWGDHGSSSSAQSGHYAPSSGGGSQGHAHSGPIAHYDAAPSAAEDLPVEAYEQAWRHPSNATVGERVRSESLESHHSYGASDGDMNLYGLDGQGELLSHHTESPVHSSTYAFTGELG